MVATPERASTRPALTWVASLIGGALLLWLASMKLPLWPDEVSLPRTDLLWLAVALQVPYGLVRALRLRYVLDPLVAAADESRRRFSPSVLYGSGLVSFFVLILLPLRLGELSRPVLLARGHQPGVGVPESIGAVAVERVVDGLMVVGLLFVGLAVSEPVAATPEIAERLDYVHWFGQVMAGLFVLGLLGLCVLAKLPARGEALTRKILGLVSAAVAERVGGVVGRVAVSLQPLVRFSTGAPFVGWSLIYWAITVSQSWLVMGACGLDFGLAQAAAVVAIVGLSIQLPGGPAQAGNFQFGIMTALLLFLPAGPVGAAGATFAVVMYLLALLGAGVLALAGMALLSRTPRTPDVSPGALPR